MRIQIHGKRWNLKFTKKIPPDTHGDCTAPDEPHRRIRIKETLRGKTELETLIHEILHAADWSKEESWIAETARDFAKILWRLGYRRTSED